MSTVRLPAVLRAQANGEKAIEVDGETVGAVVKGVVERHPALAAQLLIYPVTSHDLNTPSYSLFSDGYLLTRNAM